MRLFFGAIIASTCVFIENADGLFSGKNDRPKGRRLKKFQDEEAPPPQTTTTTRMPYPRTMDDVIRQQLGTRVRKLKYDDQYYVGSNGGPVADGDDLECNFQGFCCWNNVKQPTDQFDWFWATGAADSDNLKKNFGPSRQPSGRYLIAARQRSSATDEAMFVSCTITCTLRPIKVQFRHWTTQGVHLQVCSSETFFNENDNLQLINCKDVKKSESPGPSTITIPPGEFVDIVFVASNFQNQYGGVAIIDDIKVDIVPCPNKPKSET